MKSIEIFNFKNFRHLQIDNLGALNLIVGRNNTGKSTLLEAISILVSGGNSGWLKKILEIRGWNSQFSHIEEHNLETLELTTLCSLSNGRNFENFKNHPIALRSVGEKAGGEVGDSVEIRLVELVAVVEKDETGSEFKRFILKDKVRDKYETIAGQPVLGVSISFNGVKSIYTLDGFFGRRSFSIEKNTPFEYVRTADISGVNNPQMFDKIALSPLEDKLIDALKIIDPHISAINFLNDESRSRVSSNRIADVRVPFVVCDNMYGKYRLSAMGDGVNRILTIVLSLLNCKDGVLLVDEFENGLHYTVQTAL